MSKLRHVLLMILALALVQRPVDMLLTAMLPDAAVNPLPQCIAGMAMAILLLGVPAWTLRPWTSLRLPKMKSYVPGCAAAVAIALLCRMALLPLDRAWQGWLGLAPESLPVPENVPAAMVYIVALVIVPAVAEEIFFRGVVLTTLLDGGRRVTAVLLTTAAFALMHGSPANLPGHLILSLLLTLLMLRTGRIAVPMTAHFIYNLTALSWVSIPPWGSLLCGAALAAAAACLCIRLPKYAQQPMRLPEGLIAAAAVGVMAANLM